MSLYTKIPIASAGPILTDTSNSDLTLAAGLGVLCGIMILVAVVVLWTLYDFNKHTKPK